MAKRDIRDLDGRLLGGRRDLVAGEPIGRKPRLRSTPEQRIKAKRERIERFLANPGAPGHDTFCVCEQCDRIRNPQLWARRDRDGWSLGK